MSEPASLIVRCRIAPDALRQCLAARAPRALDWGDWDHLGHFLTPGELADIDLQTGAATGDFLRMLRRNAEHPADWLFAYDVDEQSLTVAQSLLTEDWTAIVAALAVLRRLGQFTVAQQPGIILVHDWIFQRRGTLAAVRLGGGGSLILNATEFPDNAERLAAEILAPLRDGVIANRSGPMRDDLDRWSGAR